MLYIWPDWSRNFSRQRCLDLLEWISKKKKQRCKEAKHEGLSVRFACPFSWGSICKIYMSFHHMEAATFGDREPKIRNGFFVMFSYPLHYWISSVQFLIQAHLFYLFNIYEHFFYMHIMQQLVIVKIINAIIKYDAIFKLIFSFNIALRKTVTIYCEQGLLGRGS